MLINEGRLREGAAAPLGVKTAALRSHLRSISLKTGVLGQVELIHRLHGVARSVRAGL